MGALTHGALPFLEGSYDPPHQEKPKE
ncbi:protein of unknown function [Methanoculleus bourgensis]|uniref:Uncharacterized protein n=1 Tax=Methanoculleus bourgensis TaxID=83986 RepID=A0A0X3BMU0_9EURY|nr:protein of unknown function [Methanoculleus bourgensis]